MPVTRRTVLECLAAGSDAESRDTTTVDALVAELDGDEQTVEAHVAALEACELAHMTPNGDARVTITGEELLALEPDELLVVAPRTPTEGA
jgi:hypothetical protein